MNIKNQNVEALRHELGLLVQNHGVVALKTGTEVEDMDDLEIEFLRRLSLFDHDGDLQSTHRVLPLVVKIGGPEARRDIRMCLTYGIDVILAPMVESTYSLCNFVDSTTELCKEVLGRPPRLLGDLDSQYHPELAMNLETDTAWLHFDSMLFSRAALSLGQITIGRGDLSKSMHLSVDAPEVTQRTKAVIEKCRNLGLRTSVGGGISIHNIATMAQEFNSHRFNTRHMVFTNTPEFKLKAKDNLIAGLRFEQKLYEALGAIVPSKKTSYLERSRILASRIEGNGSV